MTSASCNAKINENSHGVAVTPQQLADAELDKLANVLNRLGLLIAFFTFWIIAPTWAEESDPGKTQYLSSCAGCHGDDGKGNGPVSVKLQTKPPNLTALAKRNKGVFPISAVYQAIDGRELSEGHSAREMPIWGCRHTVPYIPSPVSPKKKFRSKAIKPNLFELHLDLGCDPEDVIANRILSVIEYLRRIQEK